MTWPDSPTIANVKSMRPTFSPLLLAEITWSDGVVLAVASVGINPEESGINSISWNGQQYVGRIKNPDVAAAQALGACGIGISPTVQLLLSDPDCYIFNRYEVLKGFRGATMVCRVIFWEPGTSNFTSDSRIIFSGICNSPSDASAVEIAIDAVSKLNVQRVEIPPVSVQRMCPWLYPDTPEKKAECNDPFSLYYQCGDDHPENTSCDHTPANCVANKQWVDRGLTALIPGGRRRFGGLGNWNPPSQWGPGSPAANLGLSKQNTNVGLNLAAFSEYIPLAYGTVWMDPIIMTVLGDANYSYAECLCTIGQMDDGYYTTPVMVVVNDLLLALSGGPSSETAHVGWWDIVATGDRDGGTTTGSPYDGKGDCYGSMNMLLIVVARGPGGFESDTLPQVRILMPGVQVLFYTDITQPPSLERFGDAYDPIPFENPVWQIMDLLHKGGFKADDLNLQTWIDAAHHCGHMIPYTLLVPVTDSTTVVTPQTLGYLSPGMPGYSPYVAQQIQDMINSTPALLPPVKDPTLNPLKAIHVRYATSLYIRQRRSLAEIIEGLLNACRAILVQEGGKLSIYNKMTLADQQPNPIPESNDQSPYESLRVAYSEDVDLSGNPIDIRTAGINGYVAYHFDDSSILKESNGQSSLHIMQRRIPDSPNKIKYQFFDADNSYQQDSITIVDAEDVGRVGQEVIGTLPIEGPNTMDHVQRVIEMMLAETLRGNPFGNSTGTWWGVWKGGIDAVHLRPGNIVSLSSKRWDLWASGDPENDYPQKQLFRLTKVQVAPDWSSITFEAFWHEDGYCTDYYGQTGQDPWKSQQLQNRKRLPYPWRPFEIRVPPADPLYQRGYTFGIEVDYDTSSLAPSAMIALHGKSPVNTFATGVLQSPYVSGFIAGGFTTGGNLESGKTYVMVLVARDLSSNKVSPPSIVVTGTTPFDVVTKVLGIVGNPGDSLTVSVDSNKFFDGDLVQWVGSGLDGGSSLNGQYYVTNIGLTSFQLTDLLGNPVLAPSAALKVPGKISRVSFTCRLEISHVRWGAGVGGYYLFAGPSETSMMVAQKVTNPNPPSVVVFDVDPSQGTFGPPDQVFSSLQAQAVLEAHAGIWGDIVEITNATSIAGLDPDATLGNDQIKFVSTSWAEGLYVGRCLSRLSAAADEFSPSSFLPVLNYRVMVDHAVGTSNILTLGAASIEAVREDDTGVYVKISNHGYVKASDPGYTVSDLIAIAGALGTTEINGSWTAVPENVDWVMLSGCSRAGGHDGGEYTGGGYVKVDLIADGVKAYDVIVMRAMPYHLADPSVAVTATSITDDLWINSLSGGTGISSISLWPLTPVSIGAPGHPFKEGDSVSIFDLADDYAFLNGVHTGIHVIDANSIALTDATITAGLSQYMGGGYIELAGKRTNEDAGKYVSIIAGRGAGTRAQITGNNQTTLNVSGWAIAPDSTSVFVVDEATPLALTPVGNSLSNAIMQDDTLALGMSLMADAAGMFNRVVRLTAYTVDSTGRLAAYGPWREMYVYWHPSTNIVDFASWDLGVPTQEATSTLVLLPKNDMAQHKIIQVAGDLVDIAGNVKTWVTSGGGSLYFKIEYSENQGSTWISIHASDALTDLFKIPGDGTGQYPFTKFVNNPFHVKKNGWLRISLIADPSGASAAQDVHVMLRWSAPLGSA